MVEMAENNLSVAKRVVEVVSLVFLTLTEAVVFITSGLAGSSNASNFGFINRTGAVSDKFYTQITPAGFTFSIWGVIYTWDTLWILYAWSFVFRPSAQRTLCIPMFWIRTFINCLNITWIYVWGNEEIIAASVILYFFALSFYTSNAVMVIYFFRVQQKVNRVDKVLTYVLPMNGMFIYTTWATIASQLNLTIAVAYTTSFGATESATVGLTLLLVLLIVYFILESTFGERYLRYVYSVYPVIIWASIGVLTAHWGVESEGRTNKIYVMVVMCIAIVFLLTKIVLSILCTKLRPNIQVQRNLIRQDEFKDEEQNSI